MTNILSVIMIFSGQTQNAHKRRFKVYLILKGNTIYGNINEVFVWLNWVDTQNIREISKTKIDFKFNVNTKTDVSLNWMTKL